MPGFLRSFCSRDILSDRSATHVAGRAAYKAVELGMLNLVKESYSILAVLADESNKNVDTSSGDRHLTWKAPDIIQFLCEASTDTEELTAIGVERLDEQELADLEQKLIQNLPYVADGVDALNASETDFEFLKARVRELESGGNKRAVDATTGYTAMRISSGLARLLSMALHLNKTSEADEIMSRIAKRIHANQQSVYLAQIRPAWGRYFLSGWLRDKLGLTEHELKEYARFVCETTKKRLKEGPLKPVDMYKDKTMEKMLTELDQNNLSCKEQYEKLRYKWDEEGEPEEDFNTILRKPATPEQIAMAEANIGRPLPDDLKAFYALTNGTRPVVIYATSTCLLSYRLPEIQSLFWEDDDYMNDYSFELLPGAKLPISIDWPDIEGGGIAMYEHDGQGTQYVWYLNEQLVAKAKKILIDAYEAAKEEDQKILDGLVEDYHGGWEQLKELKACWYQQKWGDPDSMIVFHDFREFLSLVIFKGRVDEDKSPLRASERD